MSEKIITLGAEDRKIVDLEYERERARRNASAESEMPRTRLECLRIAKEILMENRRTKPVQEAGDLTFEAIKTFSEQLEGYVFGTAE